MLQRLQLRWRDGDLRCFLSYHSRSVPDRIVENRLHLIRKQQSGWLDADDCQEVDDVAIRVRDALAMKQETSS